MVAASPTNERCHFNWITVNENGGKELCFPPAADDVCLGSVGTPMNDADPAWNPEHFPLKTEEREQVQTRAGTPAYPVQGLSETDGSATIPRARHHCLKAGLQRPIPSPT